MYICNVSILLVLKNCFLEEIKQINLRDMKITLIELVKREMLSSFYGKTNKNVNQNFSYQSFYFSLNVESKVKYSLRT